MKPRFRTLALVTVCSLGFSTAACGSGSDDDDDTEPRFGYALPRPIVTLNAASSLGAATDAAKVSARLYPGAYLTGPDGRLLPNTDLVTATPTPDNGDVIDYRITESATYSDGEPVVCDDFLLSWVAAENQDMFTSDLGLMQRIEDFSCDPGAKDFQVTMEKGMGSRFRELFNVGEVLPSHTIAERAGVPNAGDAINSGNDEQLAALGDSWRTTFKVAENDPATVPTYGPYRVTSRGEDGSLSLDVNPEWQGVQPGIDEVVLWSGGGAGIEAPDYKALADDDQLYVADVPPQTDPVEAGFEADPSSTEEGDSSTQTESGDAGDRDGVRADNDNSEAPDLSESDSGAGRFAVSRGSGTRVDGLSLSDSGVFESVENRRALSRCVDRAAVADTVEQESGISVDEAPFRIVPPGATEAGNLGSVAQRNNDRNTEEASRALGGTTVRVGFFADVAHFAPMVDAVAASCAEADITIEPVPLSADDFGQLGNEYDALLETRSSFGHNPQVTVPMSVGSLTTRELRDAENRLADDAATIPLTAEPRSVAVDRSLENVVDNPGETGMSWNMDRWSSSLFPNNTDTDDDGAGASTTPAEETP